MQIAKIVLQMGSTAVLARLLTPKDFGLIAMVTVVVGLVGLLNEAGLSSATVQRSRVDHGQISTLFWINAALGLVAAVFIYSIGHYQFSQRILDMGLWEACERDNAAAAAYWLAKGADVNARLKRLVYGAADLSAGACLSLYNVCDDPRLNHRVDLTVGVLADECGRLLTDFFAARR